MRQAFTKKKLLYVVMGFLLASTGYLYLEYQYEQKTLKAVIATVYKTPGLDRNNDEQVVLAAMQFTHNIMATNEKNPGMGLELNGFEKAFTSPLLQFALTKDGACGGNSLVLAQILHGMGYKVRPGHMKVDGSYGGHIILEAKVNNHWVVLDPMFNLSFRNTRGELASFEEVKGNWDVYRNQTPANYNPAYTFSGVRYTNWNKIPLLGPACKSVLNIFMGREAASQFSLRGFFLNPKKTLFILSFILLCISGLAILNHKYFKISFPRMLHLRRVKPQRRLEPALNI